MSGCHDNGTSICLPGRFAVTCFAHRELPPHRAVRLVNPMSCIYITGFRGQFCEKPDACYYKPCIAAAVCTNTDDPKEFKCICDDTDGRFFSIKKYHFDD